MADVETLKFLLRDIQRGLEAGYEATTREDLLHGRVAWLHEIASSLKTYIECQPDINKVEEVLRITLYGVCVCESQIGTHRRAVRDLMKNGHDRDTAERLRNEEEEGIDAEAAEILQQQKLSGTLTPLF